MIDTKQFARELNELPTNEDNRDNIMLQDIITKNEIATDNSMKLIETSLTSFRPRGSLGTPQRFLSITLRAFKIIL